MSKRAILYARVSTDDQADKGYSLPSQLELCQKYADRLGYTVVAEYREDHSGATPIAERPEGRNLVETLRLRKADALITYQVDRLSRDIVDLLTSVRMWLRAGIEVHMCDIGKIESELDIVLVIKGWQGSDERKKIIERTARGRNGKAQGGKVVGTGCAPYGYRYVRDGDNKVVGLEIQEEEARIVRQMFQWYVRGEDGKKLTAGRIRDRLISLRIPTSGESRRHYRVRKGYLWSKRSVLWILGNETYCGVWRFGKVIGARGNGGKRPIAEQIPISVPNIIDRDRWLRAQDVRKYNAQMSTRNGKRNYLLRGMVKCSCGSSMCGHFSRHCYYTCTWYLNHSTHEEQRVCRDKWIRGDALESVVWNYAQDLFSDKTKFEKLLRKAQKEERDSLAPKREEQE